MVDTRQRTEKPALDTLPSPEAKPCGFDSTDLTSVASAQEAREASGPRGALDCLSDGEVLDYTEGRASAALRARLQMHIDVCPACCELVLAALDVEGGAGAGIGLTTFATGSLVNQRYRIERFIGRGGMGEVYAARDLLMQKRVALKTLLCTATDDPRAARKLFAEVFNAQRVAHPHVCRIYELQEHRDPSLGGPPVPFFTMELVDGERLGTRMRRSPLSLDEARTIARQLLEGLQAAHAKGVLHLDFKSDNVMLRDSGGRLDAVIMDFGLSRALDNEARLRTSEQQLGAGTLPYMAFEQIECRPDLGPPADVYAFGVVLYEMLTRRLPFSGDSLGAILLRQMRERPPAPSSINPELCAEVDGFVLRCLQREPGARYAGAAQALAAFDRLGTSWHASAPRRRWRRWAAFASLFVLALALTAWRVSNTTAPSEASSAEAPSAEGSTAGAPSVDTPNVEASAAPASAVAVDLEAASADAVGAMPPRDPEAPSAEAASAEAESATPSRDDDRGDDAVEPSAAAARVPEPSSNTEPEREPEAEDSRAAPRVEPMAAGEPPASSPPREAVQKSAPSPTPSAATIAAPRAGHPSTRPRAAAKRKLPPPLPFTIESAAPLPTPAVKTNADSSRSGPP